MTINDIIYLINNNVDLVALGTLLTFLGILFTFYRQVAIPMYNTAIKPTVDFFKAIANSPQRITNLDNKLDLILEELRPNAGGSIKDVVTRLDAKLSLGEEQRLLLLNTNTHGIWVSDEEGKCTWVNDTIKKRVNARDFSDLMGENWINCVHPADRKLVQDEWDDVIETGRDFNLHYRLIDMQTQIPFNVQGIAKPARNFLGNLVGWNGVIYFL